MTYPLRIKEIKFGLLACSTKPGICLACAVMTMLLLSGCASLGVEPWQRDLLARDGMQFDSGDLNSIFSQHFYFSKEGSSGGQGFAGGGCGCN